MRRPVSIIVIAHSNVRTLPKCVASVDLYSGATDQKILVLNNPTLDVVEFSKNLDQSWEVIREDKLIGPQYARNIGAEITKHDYFVFLDDDIVIQKGWIELMMSQFTEPEIAIAQGHIQFEKHPGIFWNYLRYKNLGYFQKIRSHDKSIMCDTAAVMVKKRWFKAVNGFSKDLRLGEDSYFAFKISRNGGDIKFNSTVSVLQVYDSEETFLNHFKLCKINAERLVNLYLKTRRPNHISLKQFILKKNTGCRRPILYWLIYLILNLKFQIMFNAHRTKLFAGTEGFKIIKRKKDLFH